MMQYDLLSISYLFYWNRQKKLIGAAQKTNLDKGSLWGSENYNLGQICYAIPYCFGFSAVMNLIGVHLIHF